MTWITDAKRIKSCSPHAKLGSLLKSAKHSQNIRNNSAHINRENGGGKGNDNIDGATSRNKTKLSFSNLPNLNEIIIQERSTFIVNAEQELILLENRQNDLKNQITKISESMEENRKCNAFLDLQKYRGLTYDLENVEKRMKTLQNEKNINKFDRAVQPYLQAYTHEEETYHMERNAPRRNKFHFSQSYHPYNRPQYGIENKHIRNDMCNQLYTEEPKENISVGVDSREKRINTIVKECLSEIKKDYSPPVLQHLENHCPFCNLPYIFVTALASIVCQKCGRKKSYLDATSPFGRDNDNSFHYKRINHLNESLMLFQAKESTSISKEVLEKVMLRLYESGCSDIMKLNRWKVRDTLRELGLRKYYENEAQITFIITGQRPPQMTSGEEERMRMRFFAIQTPFRKHCPLDRKNFFSYPYVLFKFCEIEGWTRFLQCFRLHKGPDKRKYLDKLWKKICEELDGQDPTMPWPYRDTPPPSSDGNTDLSAQNHW